MGMVSGVSGGCKEDMEVEWVIKNQYTLNLIIN